MNEYYPVNAYAYFNTGLDEAEIVIDYTATHRSELYHVRIRFLDLLEYIKSKSNAQDQLKISEQSQPI